MKNSALLVVTVGGMLALLASCEDDSNTQPVMNGGGAGGDSVGAGGAAHGNGGSGGDGAGEGDGNDSFEEAVPLVLGAATSASLSPPSEDFDYFRFSGEEGDVIAVLLFAKTSIDGAPKDPFAEGLVDTVVELYDADLELIAMNDDPEPRTTNDSRLFTRLPATGEYFLRVYDFCNQAPPGACRPNYYQSIVDDSYMVLIQSPLDFTSPDKSIEGPEPNDTPQAATPVKYVPGAFGYYKDVLTFGDFADPLDVDLYGFNAPDDIAAFGTPIVEVFPHTEGSSGNGSTAAVGTLEIVDVASGEIWAAVDLTGFGPDNIPGPLGDLYLRPPIDPTRDYTVRLSASDATGIGTNPFYYFTIGIGPFRGESETEAAGASGLNDVIGSADPLVVAVNGVSTVDFLVEGDLPLNDVDIFEVPIPAGFQKYGVVCGAERSGSGLRGFGYEVKTAQGMSLEVSPVESPLQPTTLFELDVPPEPKLFVEVTSGTPSATVMSRFYRCGVTFYSPR